LSFSHVHFLCVNLAPFCPHPSLPPQAGEGAIPCRWTDCLKNVLLFRLRKEADPSTNRTKICPDL
jgi:hypothetical protein